MASYHHRWVVTSDPFTPMCEVCKVREGDLRGNLPCPGMPYPDLLPPPQRSWLERVKEFFLGP